MAKELLERKDVDENLTWDLTAIFKTEEEFEKAINEIEKLTDDIEKEFKGKLNIAKNINKCLDKYKTLAKLATLAGNYSFLAVEVDQTNTENKERQFKFMNIASNLSSKTSFIESEIIEANEEVIKKAMEESKENYNYLKEIMRKKEYALHPEVERTLAALSNTLEVPYEVYNASKLADMDFGTFKVDGKEYPLSFTLFEGKWEYETDTKIRHAAFNAFSKKLREYENTIATAYQAQVQKEKTIASLRGFDSVIDSLLFPQEVDRELYNRQIDLIMKYLVMFIKL